MVLKKTITGSSCHIFEKEKHSIEKLKFLLTEKSNLKSASIISDVYDFVLFFWSVLDSSDFRDVELYKFACECKVFKKLKQSRKDGVTCLELSVGKLSFVTLASPIKDFINPAFFLESDSVLSKLLFNWSLLSKFLAESFVKVDDDIGKILFLLTGHFFVLQVLDLYCC